MHTHGSTGLAPRHHVGCPWDFSKIGQHIKEEPCTKKNKRYLAFPSAVPEALLEGAIIDIQFLFFTPLVHIAVTPYTHTGQNSIVDKFQCVFKN
jgi:hypothetical protein